MFIRCSASFDHYSASAVEIIILINFLLIRLLSLKLPPPQVLVIKRLHTVASPVRLIIIIIYSITTSAAQGKKCNRSSVREDGPSCWDIVKSPALIPSRYRKPARKALVRERVTDRPPSGSQSHLSLLRPEELNQKQLSKC
jgi:hypothetical protein